MNGRKPTSVGVPNQMSDACQDTEHGADDHDGDTERVRLLLIGIHGERQRLLHRGINQANDDGVHSDQRG